MKFLYTLFIMLLIPAMLIAKQNKATLVMFTDSIRCPACVRLNNQVLNAPDVKIELNKFARIITADRSRPATMSQQIVKDAQKQISGRIRLPTAVIMGADGRINGVITGFMPKVIYIRELRFYRDLPPLFQAVIRGKTADLQKIMSAQKYVKASPIGTTALIMAIRLHRDDDFLKTMIRLSDKKTLQRQDSYLRTALHYAAETNRPEIVKLLLEAGVDPAKKDVRGSTAPALAQAAGHRAVIKLFN